MDFELAMAVTITIPDGIDMPDNHSYCDYHDGRDDHGDFADLPKGRRMTFSLLPLLLHEVDVPASARAALREASRSSSRQRAAWLEAAAFALAREAHLADEDARALVGLDD